MICEFIPNELRIQYECSDRILVASNLFDKYKMGIWQSRLIHIQTKNDESAAGYIYDVHPEEDTIFIPSWMYKLLTNFEINNLVELKTVEIDRIVFEPLRLDFTETDSWKQQLSHTISNYTTLIPKSQIYIPYNQSLYSIKIVDVSPNNNNYPAYIIRKNTECQVFIKAPVQEIPDIPFLVFPRRPHLHIIPFSGSGFVVGGQRSPKSQTPASMSYSAALARLRRR